MQKYKIYFTTQIFFYKPAFSIIYNHPFFFEKFTVI